MTLCKVALSDGSDLVVGEEMKIGMEFYIHYMPIFDFKLTTILLRVGTFIVLCYA